jgi:hypothetical protein
MRSTDLTKQFLTYREAARLIWNAFLRGDSTDAEDFFPEIDQALFNAIVEAHVDRDFVRLQTGSTSYCRDLEVKSPERSVLMISRKPDCNEWKEIPKPRARLRYGELFDFDYVSEHRDFEYLQCVIVDGEREPTAVPGDNVLLIRARTAKLRFIWPDDAPH